VFPKGIPINILKPALFLLFDGLINEIGYILSVVVLKTRVPRAEWSLLF
jgi:hypothetical protein